jgi:hypothetical protein
MNGEKFTALVICLRIIQFKKKGRLFIENGWTRIIEAGLYKALAEHPSVQPMYDWKRERVFTNVMLHVSNMRNIYRSAEFVFLPFELVQFRTAFMQWFFLSSLISVHLASPLADNDVTTVASRNNICLCKIWGFHGGDYEEWCLWDVTPCGCCKNLRFGGI